MRRLIFGFRSREAAHIGDMGWNELNRGNSYPLVVLGFLQLELREEVAL